MKVMRRDVDIPNTHKFTNLDIISFAGWCLFILNWDELTTQLTASFWDECFQPPEDDRAGTSWKKKKQTGIALWNLVELGK